MDEIRLNNVDESLKPVAADPMHKYKYPKTHLNHDPKDQAASSTSNNNHDEISA